MIKSMTEVELKVLLKILKPYYEHLCANHDSLLIKIFGLYRMIRKKKKYILLL
jgi:hypothetical protein